MYIYKSYWYNGTKIKGRECSIKFERKEDAIKLAHADWEKAKQRILDLYGACFEQHQEETCFFGVCDVTADCEDWWEGTIREEE